VPVSINRKQMPLKIVSVLVIYPVEFNKINFMMQMFVYFFYKLVIIRET